MLNLLADISDLLTSDQHSQPELAVTEVDENKVRPIWMKQNKNKT